MFATRNAATRHRKEVHSEVPDSPEMDVSRSSLADSDGGDHSTDDASKRLLLSSTPKVHCPKCPKMFKNKSNLKIHMLTHSGVKPFG